jgi:hypothetical protein
MRRPLPAIAPARTGAPEPRGAHGMPQLSTGPGGRPIPPFYGRGSAPPVGRSTAGLYAARQGTAAAPRPVMPARGFGLPSLRRNVCPHFYMTGSRGAIPIQAPHLLKGLLRQPNNISRCQLRGGVHMDEGYVNDVCLTPRFNQCVFYEDELTRE